ncbi:hypothetical protein D0962_10085 [Leptolyngbyaceae cyanobacterium CCMR0082]|uniref:Uncharacterized protein n=2 Tax=Adonisia turfae TaxID=2950184 RepID=A0A6M0S419_9CYAN|nr:hypothetical protein [Adonisia turfae]MDV3351604.1 hypothetical protein [Leptothoe sp. LEGE 181152]NEZ58880.1 hypothetical protein [Adonisia turfae CCMR0081]NEZ63125.1 hypothetical protein [Adonisia turfae CCMR0082]
MDASTLRLLWSVILENSPENISNLPEALFVRHLLEQIQDRVYLSIDEQNAMQSYLQAKRGLILEMIQG